MSPDPDAIVIGSGPNGLAAAVTLARAGLAVRVYERNATVGGGMRTEPLTLPGFRHDVCSAVHPMAFASGFFRRFGLAERTPFVVPSASYAHPLDDGRAGIAYRDIDRAAASLGADGRAWRRLLGPLAARADEVAQFTGSPLLRVPRHPVVAARFGLAALNQAGPWWNSTFRTEEAAALLTGVFAHATVALPSLAGAGAGLALATYAHAHGWPVPIGGSQAIADTLVADLVAHGGEVVTGTEITSLTELPPSRAVLFDTGAAAAARLGGELLPSAYRRRLTAFRTGNGVAKADFALAGPVPWANPELAEAPTVHLGGTRAAIARSENDVAAGRHSEDPYVLVSQPSFVDPSRAPAGKQVLWAYTHVPEGRPSTRRMRSSARSNGSHQASATSSSRRSRAPRPTWRGTTPTTSAGTSPRAPPASPSSSPGPSPPPTRGGCPAAVSTWHRPQPPPDRACTVSPVTTPRAAHCSTSSDCRPPRSPPDREACIRSATPGLRRRLGVPSSHVPEHSHPP